MESDSYVSCIKINGVPILPPVMTKHIKEEMSYYKQLAVGIEKRLAASRVAKTTNSSNKSSIEAINTESKDKSFKERLYSLDSNVDCSIQKSADLDESPTVTTIIDIPRIPDTTRQKDIPLNNCISNKKENAQWDLNSDEENQSQIGSRSDSVTTSIDLNGTPSIKSETPETTPELWKPQVPKTLNIIPLTLDSPNCAQEKYKNPENIDTPKLIRQGSYTLDTPSPMLLAHMQTELANADSAEHPEYVPTPTINTVRRKEWNIAQAKIEWEHQKDFSIDSKTLRKSPRDTHRIRKSISLQAKTDSPVTTYASTRSVDCIQAMLAKEYIGKSNRLNLDRNDHNDSTEVSRNQRWNKETSILNFAQRFGGSLGNLYGDLSYAKHVEIENVTANGITVENRSIGQIQDSTSRLKSSITSEKLLSVYREIQEMHKKQMAELVHRQQKEQTLLQKEFEKQQCLLLGEIKKSFPEVSVSLISENISSPALNRSANTTTLDTENDIVRICSQEQTNDRFNLQQENEVQYPPRYHGNTGTCPLDYIYSGMNSRETQCIQSIKTIENYSTTKVKTSAITPIENNDSEKTSFQLNGTHTEDRERKRLSVSRQLFPLDSKTTHVPVLDSSVYDAKHIRASNIINAYARGYLVRRMMQTERVIALKNTYKEALHCMLKLHVDAPLNRSEFHFLHRLQLQCDAASMNIVELFSQIPAKRMQVIAQDREIKRSRMERPTSARSYSFATQRTLARKKLKEMRDFQIPSLRSCSARSRCQTWTSDVKERLISPNILNQSIKRSTSAGTMRKPWR